MSKLSVNLVNEPEVSEKNVKLKSVLEDTTETGESKVRDEPSVVITYGPKHLKNGGSLPSIKRLSSGNIFASKSSALYAPMPWDSNLSSSTIELGFHLSLDDICTQVMRPTDSRSILDDEITFNIKKPPREKIDHYIEKTELDEAYGWHGYAEECSKYDIPLVSQIVNEMDNDNLNLYLDKYGITNLQLQQILRVLLSERIAVVTLDLRDNPITGSGCRPLADFLRESQKLTYLDLSNCNITETGAERLMDGIAESTSLITLKLAYCALGDQGGVYIVKGLTLNETIQELDLQANSLSSQTTTELGKMFAINKTLQRLNLDWNFLYTEPKPFTLFCRGLIKNVSITSLSLAWNGFLGTGFMRALIRGTRRIPIKTLNLESNILRGTEVPAINTLMRRAKTLEEIYLDGNNFIDEDYMTLLQGLMKTNRMKIVSLGQQTWISKETANVITALKEKYPDLQVIYKGIMRNIPADEVDMKPLVIDRCKFLAQKPKRKRRKRNMGFVMYWILDEEEPIVHRDIVIELIVKKFRAKLDKDLMEILCDTFRYMPPVEPEDPNAPPKKKKKKVKKSNLVEWHEMARYYLARHPTERGPPRFPQKKKSNKKKRKGKKEKKATGKF